MMGVKEFSIEILSTPQSSREDTRNFRVKKNLALHNLLLMFAMGVNWYIYKRP